MNDRNTLFVPVSKYPLHFLHFLRKVVSAINVFILYVNITKLSFICILVKSVINFVVEFILVKLLALDLLFNSLIEIYSNINHFTFN